jgi:hypothetical protein
MADSTVMDSTVALSVSTVTKVMGMSASVTHRAKKNLF